MQALVDKLGRKARANPEALHAKVMEAWSNYVGDLRGETMERVWAKLEDIAKIVIAAGGENDNDEGRKAGARKRVAASRAAAAPARSRANLNAAITARHWHRRHGPGLRGL